MIKYNLTIIVLFVMILNASAQVVGYTGFKSYIKKTDEVASTFRLFFNEDMLKNETEGGLGNTFTIRTKSSEDETFFIEIKDKKFRLNMPKAITSAQFPKIIAIEKTAETKTIAGHLCTKYILKTEQYGDQLYAYTTTAVQWNNHPFAASLVGYALEYNQIMPDGLELYNLADTMIFQSVEASVFDTVGYRSTTITKLQTEIQKVMEDNKLEEGNEFSFDEWLTIDHKRITKDSLEGKIVVYNFWFTACKPCVSEIPELNELVEENKENPVVFIAVTFDDDAKVKRFVEEKPFHFDLVCSQASFLQEKAILNFPTTVVVAPDGKIKRIWGGGWAGIKAKLQEDINLILAEKK